MASQALSYTADNALRLRNNSDVTEYAFIQDSRAGLGENNTEGLRIHDLMIQANDQQSNGWNKSAQMDFCAWRHLSHNSTLSLADNSMESRSSDIGVNGTPMTHQDVFYQPLGTMDISSDFSFLHRRPTSSCTPVIRPVSYTPHTPTYSELTDSSMTTQGTPLRRSQSDTPSRSESTPTPGPTMRATLSQQRRKKATSSTTGMQSSRASSVQSSTSTATSSRLAALFVNTKRLPLRLPKPPICLISDPHADLCGHLRRHGMMIEAEEFAAADGITADFALRTWIQTSAGAAEGLLNQTSDFLPTHATAIEKQIGSQALPDHFGIPVADLNTLADEHGITPTHILAIHGISDLKSGEDSRGLLLPCHALMYVLQCVSLPSFPTSKGQEMGEVKRQIPVVPFRVPRPGEFPILHRYLYTHDSSALLTDLLPMKHIARHWDQAKANQFDTTPSYSAHLSNQPPAPISAPTPPSSATNALAHLPTQTLFGFAYKIHSAWANGVAIGLLHTGYWSTLDRAWNLVMAALSIKKARILDTEMRGVHMNPPQTTT